MKKLLILGLALCAGCVGYRAELRNEQQAKYNCDVACTNSINSLNELEHSECLTNHLNEVATPDADNDSRTSLALHDRSAELKQATIIADLSDEGATPPAIKLANVWTPPHIFTNGLSLYFLTGSGLTSNAVYFYDAPRGVSDTNEDEVWFRFTNGTKVYTEYFPNWKIYNPTNVP